MNQRYRKLSLARINLITVGRTDCMTIDLEKKVIAYFLDKPKSITLYEFSQEWMTDKTHREVAYGLEVLQGEFDDFSVLVETIKDCYPFTTVTSDWLDTEK